MKKEFNYPRTDSVKQSVTTTHGGLTKVVKLIREEGGNGPMYGGDTCRTSAMQSTMKGCSNGG